MPYERFIYPNPITERQHDYLMRYAMDRCVCLRLCSEPKSVMSVPIRYDPFVDPDACPLLNHAQATNQVRPQPQRSLLGP